MKAFVRGVVSIVLWTFALMGFMFTLTSLTGLTVANSTITELKQQNSQQCPLSQRDFNRGWAAGLEDAEFQYQWERNGHPTK